MVQFSFFRSPRVWLCVLSIVLLLPGHTDATIRKDTPKGSYGALNDIFVSTPVTFTLSDASTFTLVSSVRCDTLAPQDCLSANTIFPYFYQVTIGSAVVSQKITLKITAPFDTHNSPNLTFGIIDGLDEGATSISACTTAACIDGVLAATSSYQNGILTFVLDPTTLTGGHFAAGDKIFLYATSFSPPKCSIDLTLGLSCSQATSLSGTLSLSASGGSISPTSTPGLVPILPTPHKIVAATESTYFNPSPQFTGNSVNAQATQGTTTTPLSGFVSSFVDAASCSFCGANPPNVLFGYIYNLQIPSTINISSLPGTITVGLSAPYNQDGFEFLNFGVIGTDGSGPSSVVSNCPADPTAYNACLNAIVTAVKVQPTSLTFTISTANLSPGDNLELFATSNNNPNNCSTSTFVCTSTTPLLLQGDATTALSLATGSPTTVTGPSDPLPLPVIASLAPSTIAQGAGAIPLTVNGTPMTPATDAFVAGSQVFWNGSARPTTLVSPTQLTAQIFDADFQTAGTNRVTVVNPSNPSTTVTPNGGISAPANFTVTGPNPLPTLTSLSPASTTAGGAAFTLTVTGTGFVPTSQLKFNGKAETTTFVSSTQVTASIPSADIATAATVNVTATNATPGGGTSGVLTFGIFSAKPPTVVSLSPNGGTGTSQTFSAVVSDPNGLADLRTIHLLFSPSSGNQVSQCSIFYTPGTNQLNLFNDANTTLSAPLTPGAAGTVSNSQCTLSGPGSSFSMAGNNFTLNVAVTFKAAFTGLKNVFVFGGAVNGTNSGWVLKGTWTGTLAAPTVASLTPNTGGGTTQTFSAVVSDPNGLADLRTIHLLFSPSVANQVSQCSIFYTPGTNQLNLFNDANTTLSAPLTPGAAGTVSNSQCTLSGPGSSFSMAGNNFTLNVAVTFKAAFTGLKNVFVFGGAVNGTNSGWVQKGTWTPGGSQAPTVVSLTPNSGTGTTQTFSLVVSDPNGLGDLRTVHLLFSPSSSNQVSQCSIYYALGTNQLSLFNDANTTLSGPLTPGAAGTVSNTQCTISGPGSSFSMAGNNFTLNVAVTFKAAFTGLKNAFIFAGAVNGTNSGWVQKGSWTP